MTERNYCFKCGSKLKIRLKRGAVTYNENTGEEVKEFGKICPNYTGGWLNSGWNHYNSVTENGYPYYN